jgi:hypothetical protein
MEPSVIIDVTAAARFVGFTIRAGDALPLPVGILVRHGSAEIADVEIVGTRDAAIEIAGSAQPTVRGTHLRGNHGVGILIHPGAAPRITHNLFARDSAGTVDSAAVEIRGDAKTVIVGNTITGYGPKPVIAYQEADLQHVLRTNVVTGETSVRPPPTGAGAKPRRD